MHTYIHMSTWVSLGNNFASIAFANICGLRRIRLREQNLLFVWTHPTIQLCCLNMSIRTRWTKDMIIKTRNTLLRFHAAWVSKDTHIYSLKYYSHLSLYSMLVWRWTMFVGFHEVLMLEDVSSILGDSCGPWILGWNCNNTYVCM